MRRPNRVAQVYGFSVCFVALVTSVAVLPSLVNGAFQLTDPVRADVPRLERARDLAEATRQYADVPRPARMRLPEEYAERIAAVRHRDAARDLVTYGLLFVACVTLFISHWLWVRRLLALDLQADHGVIGDSRT